MSFFQNLRDSTGEAFLVYVNEVMLNPYKLLPVFLVCLQRKWTPQRFLLKIFFVIFQCCEWFQEYGTDPEDKPQAKQSTWQDKKRTYV